MSGKLIMNALVMYDRQTDTLWSQFLSRGVRGPLSGTQLEIVPSLQTSWEQWLELHPDTQLLDKGGRYNSDSCQGYYLSGSAGIIGESNKDRRLPGKDVVLEGKAKAYPFQVIANEPLINDSISGTQVLVVLDLPSETAAIFDRNLEGRSLGFDILPDTGDGISLMKDRETGSTWQLLTGRAIDGELAGMALRPSTPSGSLGAISTPRRSFTRLAARRGSLSPAGNVDDGFHLDQILGPHQGRHHHGGAGRGIGGSEYFGPHFTVGRVVGHVHQEAGYLHHIVHGRPCGFSDALYIGEDLAGLGFAAGASQDAVVLTHGARYE